MLSRLFDPTLQLRVFRADDAAARFALIDGNRAHLRPWYEMVDRTRSVADSAAWIEDNSKRLKELGCCWSGISENGRLIGSVGVTAINEHNGWAEIGYWLGSDFCGRGIATRAVSALLEYLFDERQLHRVGLRTANTNVRSIALAKRLGFIHEGALRETSLFESARRDMLLFGLLRNEWTQRLESR
jgi:ribosomal-protein-serine acetyltransferase